MRPVLPPELAAQDASVSKSCGIVTSGQKFKMRNRPQQRRAQETVEVILDTTAHLLEEVGFDKLNTNLICERAGLTPPALYRYFPNKYAILEELGERLMSAQNEISLRWMETFKDRDATPADVAANLREQFDVTRRFPGAKWIMRSLRSVPVLAEVRFKSHETMNREFEAWLGAKFPAEDPDMIARRVRITNETGYALFEMLLDGDYTDIDETFADASVMFAALFDF